jgi:hypothetical protein
MAPVHDDEASKGPDETSCGEQRRGPRFSVEEAARRRENGFQPRSVREIAKDVMVRHAETLKRLGE